MTDLTDERLREIIAEVVELESALAQFRHCQRQGPWWFTNGEPALRAMTERWLTKADEALAKLKAAASPVSIPQDGTRERLTAWFNALPCDSIGKEHYDAMLAALEPSL